MVVESSAYKLASNSTLIGSPAYNGGATPIKTCAKSAKMRQSWDSVAFSAALVSVRPMLS